MTDEQLAKLDSVYGEIYEISIMIGQLIDRKQYNGIDHFLEIKEKLFIEAEDLLKDISDKTKLEQFSEICEKIKNQEAMNINLLTQTRDEIKQEMSKGTQKAKIVNAYNTVETKQGNLLDFRQ